MDSWHAYVIQHNPLIAAEEITLHSRESHGEKTTACAGERMCNVIALLSRNSTGSHDDEDPLDAAAMYGYENSR